MDQRTYELVANFISDRTGMRIVFEHDCIPCADPESRVIKLPYNIKDENVFGALALVMHEAAHIQHTIFDHEPITDSMPTKFEVLNAAEDIRIDAKNFRLLPNIRDFYRELYKKCVGGRVDQQWQMAPVQQRILATLITDLLSFKGMIRPDEQVDNFIKDNGLEAKMSMLCQTLNALEYTIKNEGNKVNEQVLYKQAREQVDEIHKILCGPMQPQGGKQIVKKKSKGGTGQGQGQGYGDPDDQEDSGDTGDEPDEDNDDDGESIEALTKGVDGKSVDDFDKQPKPSKKAGGGKGQGSGKGGGFKEISHHDAASLLRKPIRVVFEKGTTSSGRGSALVGEACLEEATKHGLRELLNEKCVKVIPDGVSLDTDSLHSYYTGDIDELFKDQKLVTRKKSKIILMLDASGSMQSQMVLDHGEKRKVVLANAEAIRKVLQEVVHTEGVNVAYEVWAFDDKCWKLDERDYQQSYNDKFGGGTDILVAFDRAHASLCEPDVEGEKLLLLLTDGEVHHNEVAQLKKKILMNNSNAKVLIIGVGANITGFFVKEIVGANNILAEKHSNIILFEAIMTLLGG